MSVGPPCKDKEKLVNNKCEKCEDAEKWEGKDEKDGCDGPGDESAEKLSGDDLNFEEFSEFYEEAAHAVVVHAGDNDEKADCKQNGKHGRNNGDDWVVICGADFRCRDWRDRCVDGGFWMLSAVN